MSTDRVEQYGGEEYVVRRVTGSRRDQALPLPGMPPGDPAGDPAHRGVAGAAHLVLLVGDRARRAPALAQRLLGRPRLPALTRTPGAIGDNAAMPPIRANSVLPARREALTLETADGLRLVGELALPPDRRPGRHAGLPAPAADARRDDGQPRHPQGGVPAARAGRHRGAAVQHPWHLQQAGHQRGRASTRPWGSGTTWRRPSSTPSSTTCPHIWVLGWSFGTDLALMHGRDPAVRGRRAALARRCGSAPPPHLAAWAASGKPLTALVPEHDDYLQPPEARERFAAVPQAEVVGVDGAKHLWVGDAETVLDLVVARVAPSSTSRCRGSGTGRWRPPTPAPTPTARPRRSRTCPS